MSQSEKQQELLLQLKIENQQLLKFKKLNSLMRDTLDTFAVKGRNQSPFTSLFDLLGQELQADQQFIVAINDDETSFSILDATSPQLKNLPAQLLHKKNDIDSEQHVFSQSSAFFDLALSPKWPAVLTTTLPQARSALIQPIRIGQHHYAIVLLSDKTKTFNIEAKTVVASYSSFIASFLSLFENQRLAAERDQLFAQQKRIEQSMVQQDKLAAIGQLAAGVAHELNNPLGFIYSNLNTLKVYMQTVQSFVHNAYATTPALKDVAKAANLSFLLEDSFDLIEESLTGARRSRDIINNLRTFSHPDDISVSKIDLMAILESTIRIANTQIKRNAKLILTKDIASAYVNGNATQLSQVLLNLINNAYHAIDHKQGLITVLITQLGHWLTIKITDNGCGISNSAVSHIFEPFFTTKDVGQGTGLGLSISRAIVEQHNGCLALEHTSADGSVFVVSLPVADASKDD
ncbi:His Kinase A (phospho-acceptor) domain-containing protein [Arsukibacterium tuosuense]|uniref:histidine kinase n=1 Tax=Arsukibacterium tuosuense TaxID=1323745 RepID=A0A285JJ18_9GAMM|nr:ATP-binding protein [Arsukibacterium tuosuense]SNY60330.1 His Kinase A (phospho-acceptor) domain-containing protein [Arsukibacterium tuosuense]